MHIYSTPADTDSLPLIDEEFDVIELTASSNEPMFLFPADDLAWDDQLDQGEEMSV